jgi:hypothetical protein
VNKSLRCVSVSVTNTRRQGDRRGSCVKVDNVVFPVDLCNILPVGEGTMSNGVETVP